MSEEVGSAYATIGIKIDEAGLNAAKNTLSSAVGGLEGDFKNRGSGLKDYMSSMAASMGPIGGALSAIGPAGIAAGAGIAVVGGAISSSVAVAGQFQQTMSGVAAVAGATAPQLELMATAARDAGASSVFSASQAAEAMGFLASSGMSVSDTIATLEPTLLMAAAGGLGLAEAGDLMAGSLAQFNLDATDATSVADTLAAGAAASNASVTQLGQGLQNVGPMAASVGMSLQETTAALGVFANSNIKGAEAGTALKSMIASLLEPTKGAAAALSEMGISADQVNPSLHSYDEIMSTLKDSHMTAQQSVAIFGKEMAANALVAVNGADSYDELLTKVSETGKASEMAKTQTDNYAGAMSEFSGAIEEAQITLGTAFLPVLTDVTQALTTGVRAALDFAGGIGDAWSSITSGDAANDISTMLSGDLYKGMEGLLGFHNEDYVSAGEEIGDRVGEGVSTSEDLAAAPGEALGSPEALAGAGAAGKDIAAAVFDPEAWQLAANDAIITSMKAAGPGAARADWKNNQGKTLGTAKVGNVDLATKFSVTKTSTSIQIVDASGNVLDEIEYYYKSGYTAEQAMAELLSRDKWRTLDAIQKARLTGDTAKVTELELQSALEVKTKINIADLIFDPEVKTKINIADLIFDPEAKIKSKIDELFSAAASALEDGALSMGRNSEQTDLLGLAQDIESLERKFPGTMGKIGGEGGAALIEALKRNDFAGAMAIIGKEAGEAAGDKAAEAFYGKLADGSGRFFGDFQTQVQTWQTYVNGEGGFVGPTEYYDEYYAAKAGQQIRAMEAHQNVEDIKVGLSVDVETAKQQLQAFYDEQKKDEGKSELEKTLEIDDDQAKTDIAAIDTAAKLGVIKPFSLDGVDYAMGQIAAIDDAASQSVTKMIYVQTSYGRSGGGGGGRGIWESWGGFPSFATGDVFVRQPTLAVVGDRPGGEWIGGLDQARERFGKGNGGNIVNVTFNNYGTVTGEEIVDSIVSIAKEQIAYEMNRRKY